MEVYLYPNLSKRNCYEYTLEACDILRKNGMGMSMHEKYSDIFKEVEGLRFSHDDEYVKDCDVMLAIGGDGTILKCALKASKYQKPILGINCGRLGFMASLEYSQLEDLARLAQGDYSTSRRMMLNARVKGHEEVFYALNDVVVSRSDDCKIADFEVIKDGKAVSCLRANGVIFSTATGATAYSMSAGGPIIEPEMECIEYTQICPHSLFARSMIFSAQSIINVVCHTGDNSHVCLNVDGNTVYRLSEGGEIIICRSPVYLDIIDINGGSFFASVNSKLMMPLKGSADQL